MKTIELKPREDLSDDLKLSRVYVQLDTYLKEVNKKELPQPIVASVNQDIEEINSTTLKDGALSRFVKRKQTQIIQKIQKELKIVPKKYYRNMWLALGMTAFGLPIGVAIGMSLGNIGLLGIGLPIGMVFGLFVGKKMDQKAFEENRQLDVEIRY
ncbi:MAG TPA: hypothetical protein VLZ11_08925 [Flavobacterium sp.]|nr:hypothetical protein [Flavobacterium sp.]